MASELLPGETRGHGRSPSGDERRRAIPRRSTRGPLDLDHSDIDPLASDAPTDAPSSTTTITTKPPTPIPERASLDVSFLQDPTAYHVLPTTAPAPFTNAPTAPSVSSPIASLLASGHYRLAAIAAARNIVTAASPSDYSTLFHLVHVRLACLCLINEHALAAQESKVLGDLSSSFYRHPTTHAHLVPWSLRLLAVRLAALGYGEWRKGIMGYYELARECRSALLSQATREEDKPTWRHRLHDTGLRVANALLEMGDAAASAAHLASLPRGDTPEQARELLVAEALTWLRLGDVAAARAALSTAPVPDALVDGTLSALLSLADGDYASARTQFSTLSQSYPDDAMLAQNLGVCELYTCSIASARSTLEGLVVGGAPFHSLVFNLCTVFELCSERARELKMGVAAELAGRRDGGGVGWERGTGEFKL